MDKRNKTKIAIGCGKRFYGEEWLHIDADNTFKHVESKDIFLKGIEDNSLDLIYACHFLNYFTRKEAKELASVWRDKLKEGGILRLAVPNFNILCELYLNKGIELEDISSIIHGVWKVKNKEFVEEYNTGGIGHIETTEKEIVHKTSWDIHDLMILLIELGFIQIQIYDWKKTEHSHIDDHSRAHLPHDPEAIRTGEFNEKHTLISLNVEAIK